VVGGAFVSILGGSRFQIGGPAGAFIVLVASTIEQHGYPALAPRPSWLACSCC
jgi:SulP family sulfate permease